MVSVVDLSKSSQRTTPKAQRAENHPAQGSKSSSEASSSPDSDEEAGVRLTDLNLNNSPVGYGRGPYMTPHVKKDAQSTPKPVVDNTTVTFQIGKPADDVFNSPIQNFQQRRSVTAIKASRRLGSGQILPAKVGDSTELTVLTELNQNLRHQSSDVLGGRSGVDAQGVYPQSACIFVANLPEGKDDRTLEAALTREFSKYGTVFVKIRRDSQNMPFAFCQYTLDDDAKEAVEQGRGTLILGRACRTEMVKANRAFTIYKVDGSEITVGEGYALMLPYGELDICETATSHKAGDAPAINVQFRMYDASRDLVTAFRNNHKYRVIAAFDPASRTRVRPKNSNEQFLNKYDVDRRSIFVDGLPEDVGKEEVKSLFEPLGEVLNVQVIKKVIPTGIRVYGFVKFAQIHTPELAITKFHGTGFHGCTLRVERKLGKQPFRMPRRVQSQMLPSDTVLDSPTPMIAGPRRGQAAAQRSASNMPSRGPSAIYHPGGAIVSGGSAPAPVAAPVVGPAPGGDNIGMPFVGQTPVHHPPPFGYGPMAYGGHHGYANPGPYFAATPPVGPPMHPWGYSHPPPAWGFYPYPSPTAMSFPSTIPEGTAEDNGQGEEGNQPAAAEH